MTKMGKKELILSTKPRYLKASKKEKTKILDEFCENTGYDRKYAITIFQAKCDYRRVSRDGRKPRAKKYGHDVMAVIVKIWELLDYPCGTRLKPSLMPILESMLSFGEITITDEIKEKMKTISARTLDRRLDIWKLILYLITEAILAVNLLAPWIWWRYSQAGLNKPFLWAKVKLQQLTQWMISRKNCRFGC